MKKAISILLVLIIVIGLGACGNEEHSQEKTLSDRAADAVENHIWSYVYVAYNQPQNILVNTTHISQTNDNTFKVSGKVTVTDKYGDKFTGKYDATATYNPSTDDFDVQYDVGTLYRQSMSAW